VTSSHATALQLGKGHTNALCTLLECMTWLYPVARATTPRKRVGCCVWCSPSCTVTGTSAIIAACMQAQSSAPRPESNSIDDSVIGTSGWCNDKIAACYMWLHTHHSFGTSTFCEHIQPQSHLMCPKLRLVDQCHFDCLGTFKKTYVMTR